MKMESSQIRHIGSMIIQVLFKEHGEFGDIDGDGDQDISNGEGHAGTQEVFLWGDVPEFSTQRIDYTISSAHDYENDTDEEYVNFLPGIDGIQLFIGNFSTYNRYDRLMIKDLDGNILQTSLSN